MNHLATVFIAGTILLAGGQDITEAIRKDKAALQGTWKVTSSESKGEKVPAEDLKELFLIFRGDAILIREGGKRRRRNFPSCSIQPKNPRKST